MFERYKEDIQCFMEHDPAARSPIEIVLLYPGFKALRSHRKAQWFLNHKMPFIARYISQRTAHKTGIEIHPGAKIGRRVCIDHGNGKVAAGAVVVKDVEPNCTVVGVPGEVVRIDGERVDDLDQINLPDPVMNAIQQNEAKINALQAEIEKLKEQIK